MLEKEEERANEWIEMSKESHRKAEETFEKAMKDLPTGWKRVGMNVSCH